MPTKTTRSISWFLNLFFGSLNGRAECKGKTEELRKSFEDHCKKAEEVRDNLEKTDTIKIVFSKKT